jgi:hypothetical protein
VQVCKLQGGAGFAVLDRAEPAADAANVAGPAFAFVDPGWRIRGPCVVVDLGRFFFAVFARSLTLAERGVQLVGVRDSVLGLALDQVVREVAGAQRAAARVGARQAGDPAVVVVFDPFAGQAVPRVVFIGLDIAFGFGVADLDMATISSTQSPAMPAEHHIANPCISLARDARHELAGGHRQHMSRRLQQETSPPEKVERPTSASPEAHSRPSTNPQKAQLPLHRLTQKVTRSR